MRTASETLKARTKHYLFVLMYDRMTQPEQVKAACAHFSASEEGKGCCVVLYDAARSRALLCGPPPADEKTRKVLGALGV